MVALAWDVVGERMFETGVDHGVLYIPDATSGAYSTGVAWNGLTGVTESPSGAEASAVYADNIKYLNLISAEEFGATIEAFTYPPEFNALDGSADGAPGATGEASGLYVGQQNRGMFGLSYRTRVGNDVMGSDKGYKLHMVYGCVAAPTERAYVTINDSPEAITFSWEVTTTPVPVTGFKPTALLTVNSVEADPVKLAALETILYGDETTEARLPLPDEIIGIFEGVPIG